jgi:hypothetical protein
MKFLAFVAIVANLAIHPSDAFLAQPGNHASVRVPTMALEAEKGSKRKAALKVSFVKIAILFAYFEFASNLLTYTVGTPTKKRQSEKLRGLLGL